MARPTVETIPAHAPIEKILEILHRDGVVVLSDFVGACFIERYID